MKAEYQQCPLCGSPIDERGRPERPASMYERRPTEDECWQAFWTKLAAAWASLPRDVQEKCLAEDGKVIRQRRPLSPQQTTTSG